MPGPPTTTLRGVSRLDNGSYYVGVTAESVNVRIGGLPSEQQAAHAYDVLCLIRERLHGVKAFSAERLHFPRSMYAHLQAGIEGCKDLLDAGTLCRQYRTDKVFEGLALASAGRAPALRREALRDAGPGQQGGDGQLGQQQQQQGGGPGQQQERQEERAPAVEHGEEQHAPRQPVPGRHGARQQPGRDQRLPLQPEEGQGARQPPARGLHIPTVRVKDLKQHKKEVNLAFIQPERLGGPPKFFRTLLRAGKVQAACAADLARLWCARQRGGQPSDAQLEHPLRLYGDIAAQAQQQVGYQQLREFLLQLRNDGTLSQLAFAAPAAIAAAAMEGWVAGQAPPQLAAPAGRVGGNGPARQRDPAPSSAARKAGKGAKRQRSEQAVTSGQQQQPAAAGAQPWSQRQQQQQQQPPRATGWQPGSKATHLRFVDDAESSEEQQQQQQPASSSMQGRGVSAVKVKRHKQQPAESEQQPSTPPLQPSQQQQPQAEAQAEGKKGKGKGKKKRDRQAEEEEADAAEQRQRQERPQGEDGGQEEQQQASQPARSKKAKKRRRAAEEEDAGSVRSQAQAQAEPAVAASVGAQSAERAQGGAVTAAVAAQAANLPADVPAGAGGWWAVNRLRPLLQTLLVPEEVSSFAIHFTAADHEEQEGLYSMLRACLAARDARGVRAWVGRCGR